MSVCDHGITHYLRFVHMIQFFIIVRPVENPVVIYIPNIFSPNGDQQNDVLYVMGEGIKTLEFSVYDRWGDCVFKQRIRQLVGMEHSEAG